VTLTKGDRLGRFEILGTLGAGGMGEVYRARDIDLDRQVAVKVLPDAFAREPERISRFEREARLLASLNHQNIAILHGIEEHDGLRFLVMELVEGESLAARLERGPVPVDEALEIALQIAKGLEAAHRQGIVHRDLKPANVMLSPEGRIKVLDFGLGKAWQSGDGDPDLTQSETVSVEMTAHGVVFGTVAYMSPEQARGKQVDNRTDIWAYGCVLYQMLVGVPPFRGETVTDVLASVVTEEPDLEALPDATPAPVHHLIGRCLQKDPKRRLHAIADARIEIEDAVGEPPRPHPPPSTSNGEKRRGLSWIAAAILIATGVIVGGGLAVGFLEDRGRSSEPVPPRGLQPVIFLMDTPAPRGVYDPETRLNSGTNADDLNDILRDLPVVLHKETLGAMWDREDQILKQQPDLIVIHKSAFFHSANLEFGFGYPPFDNPVSTARFSHFYELVNSKLVAFLGYVALGDPLTKFLVYSRGSGGDWPDEDRAAWVADAEKRFPRLEGRLFTLRVPVGPGGEGSFRESITGQSMRKRVVDLLGLEGAADGEDTGPTAIGAGD
jgi:serine/threonine protein kinase